MKRLLFLTLTILMLSTSTALADAPQVTLVTPGGTQKTLALEALTGTEDVIGQTYALRSEAGESSTTVTGFSIDALLKAANIDPYGFSYLEVQRPSGGAVQLSSTQALAEPAPVVYATPTGTAFLRPSSGPGDDNAGDAFEAPQGLTIALRKGSSLQVRVEATPRHTEVGKKVSFKAIVERAGSGEVLDYSWYFDDGNSGEGATAVHSFAKPGSYAVVVGVKAEGEETGTSAVVRIQVGKASTGGPNRQGGGTNKATNAPDGGASEGASGSGAEAAAPSEGGGPASTSGAATPAVPPSSPTANTPDPRHKNKAAAKSAPAPKKEAAPTPEPSGEEVRGELLEGEAEAKPEVTKTKQVAARTGTPEARDGDGGGGVPAAAWGLGAVVALLGVGALGEAGAFTDLIPRTLGRLR
jgi:PKD repeat protein